MAKQNNDTYEYVMEKVIKVIGDDKKKHQTVELGYYLKNREKMNTNVYIFSHYFNPNGEIVKAKNPEYKFTIEFYEELTGNKVK